jgi:hypothetical protein
MHAAFACEHNSRVNLDEFARKNWLREIDIAYVRGHAVVCAPPDGAGVGRFVDPLQHSAGGHSMTGHRDFRWRSEKSERKPIRASLSHDRPSPRAAEATARVGGNLMA